METPATFYTSMPSPVGTLLLTATAKGLSGLYMKGEEGSPATEVGWLADPARFHDVCIQLDGYFRGAVREFRLPLDLAGTTFELQVWNALREIPFGETISYGELARRIGRPSAARAVGAANGRNPVSIIIPCHRVIGSDGSLTGYGGGLPIKRALLEHEARILAAAGTPVRGGQLLLQV